LTVSVCKATSLDQTYQRSNRFKKNELRKREAIILANTKEKTYVLLHIAPVQKARILDQNSEVIYSKRKKQQFRQ